MDRLDVTLSQVLQHEEEEKHPAHQQFRTFRDLIEERNAKFTEDWDPLEVCSFLLEQMSSEIECGKNTQSSLQRILRSMKTPYELLLALSDFNAFSEHSVDRKISAQRLFDWDKEGKLYSMIKDNRQRISDQTGDIYAEWIKDKLLRAEYTNIAKRAREMFTEQFPRDTLQSQITRQIKDERLSFEILADKEDEKEFVDFLGGELEIYNDRCCRHMFREKENYRPFGEDAVMEWRPHQIARWFTNYRKDQIYRLVKRRKFTWKYFAGNQEDAVKSFHDKIPILTDSESKQLFDLMHKLYLGKRKRAAGDSVMGGDDERVFLGLPTLLDPVKDIVASDHYYCCDGSCHDPHDAIHSLRTSFGQLLLFMKKEHGEITSYHHLKQLWFDKMYRNEPKLIHLDISDKFDEVLAECQRNARIRRVIEDCLELRQSAFVRELGKCRKKLINSSQDRMQFLMKIVSKMDRVFEAKFIFYALLHASCRGRDQYEFDHDAVEESNSGKEQIEESESERFTVEERRQIREYLANADVVRHRNGQRLSCAEKYYLRSVLSAIVRVSCGAKEKAFNDGNTKQTMYLPLTEEKIVAFGREHSSVTPTERYKAKEHGVNNAVLLRLQSPASFFGAHFVDLQEDGDLMTVATEQCDGYLFAPFRVNHAVQSRMRTKEKEVVLHHCTDIHSMELDQLDPFLSIQQFSNFRFVLVRMFHVLLSHHSRPSLSSAAPLDHKQIQEKFGEKVEEQSRGDLKQFLGRRCGLEASEMDAILISDPKMNKFISSLSEFLWIDQDTLSKSVQSDAKVTKRVIAKIESERAKFLEHIASVLETEFADRDHIERAFKEQRIATFDHDVFYDEKRLEQLLPHCRQRALLLRSKFVLKAYFKKAHRHFIAARNTLRALFQHDRDHNNTIDRNSILKRVFGALYDTLSPLKSSGANSDGGDDLDSDDDVQANDAGVDVLEKRNPNEVFRKELLNGLQALSLADDKAFELVFLPKFDRVSPEQKGMIHSMLCTYFRRTSRGRKVYKMYDAPLERAIAERESVAECFVLIEADVIGYVFDPVSDDSKEEELRETDPSPTMHVLNASERTIASCLQSIRVHRTEEGQRRATLSHFGDRDERRSMGLELEEMVQRFVFSDGQQRGQWAAFENALRFELSVKSIKTQIAKRMMVNEATAESVNLTDPQKEAKSLDFTVYDVVELEESMLNSVWRRSHREQGVDSKVWGMVTRVDVLNVAEQEEWHRMVIDAVRELADSDVLIGGGGGMEMGLEEESSIGALCRKVPWLWAIGDAVKMTHQRVQLVTVEWDIDGAKVRGLYPVFGHFAAIKRVEDVPRVFDVVIYDGYLCSVYSVELKAERALELSIINCSIGNNADLTKKMMTILYSESTLQIVTDKLSEWQLQRKDSVWFLPIYGGDCVVRKGSDVAGKVTAVWTDSCQSLRASSSLNLTKHGVDGDMNMDADGSGDGPKLPLIHVEVEWMVPSRGSQSVFVWLGIGNVADNASFKYTADGGASYRISNELQLTSLEAGDRVSRGRDWDQELFEDQDEGNLLGKVSRIKIASNVHGGYEVDVRWDNEMTFNYRHGLSSAAFAPKFDVEIIQRTSRVDRRPAIHCGDTVVRGHSWKWNEQDRAITDRGGRLMLPQIGMVTEIELNDNDATVHDDAEQNPKAVDTKPLKQYIDEHSARRSEPLSAPQSRPKERNETLVYVEWIASPYAKGLETEETMETHHDGMFAFEYHHGEKYRFGLGGAFDVAVVGPHAPISLGPRTQWTPDHFVEFERQHALNSLVDAHSGQNTKAQRDVLVDTFYTTQRLRALGVMAADPGGDGQGDSDNNINTDRHHRYSPREWDEYIKTMLSNHEKASKWPQPVIDRLNQRSKHFVTRFVDANSLKQ